MTDIEQKMTLRFYSYPMIERLNENYLKYAGKGTSKNAFITDLIIRGLDDLEDEKQPESKKILTLRKLAESIDKLDKSLNATMEFLNVNAQMNTNERKVTLKLLSCIYEMTKALIECENLDAEDIESGFYDELPLRLKKVLYDLKF